MAEEKKYFGFEEDKILMDESIKHIELHHSIDLRNFLLPQLNNYRNSREFNAAVNRIRHTILLDKRYRESTQKEASGKNFRIMFNPDYGLDENIKATNDSFRNLNDIILPQNFILQRNLAIITIVVAAVSAVAIIASAVIASKGVTSSDIKRIDTLLQQNTQLLDSMQKFQKRIETSLEKVVKDSFYQRK